MHLFNRGFYKPMGISGERCEDITGITWNIWEYSRRKVELNGYYMLGVGRNWGVSFYLLQRLSRSHFKAIVLQRRRNCYRIDEEQMNVEITRGRSDIYDILIWLSFSFTKLETGLLDEAGEVSRDWMKLEQAVSQTKNYL
jgi:hypothetical protein